MTDRFEAIVRVLEDEGALPGNSIHSWRCEYPGIYGTCDCLEQVANLILAAIDGANVTGV